MRNWNPPRRSGLERRKAEQKEYVVIFAQALNIK